MQVLSPELLGRCRELRRKLTDAEILMWQLLRNRGLMGYKFRRQHPMGPFILDFYCDEVKLAVELDGGHHSLQVEKDAARTRDLEDQGITVLRYWNDVVLENTEGVLVDILRKAEELKKALVRPSPGLRPPSPKGRG